MTPQKTTLTKGILIDTDIIIDYFRDYEPAIRYLEQTSSAFLISSVTVAEIYAGIRSPEEQTVIENFLCVFSVLPVDQDIAMLGGSFCKQYRKSHGTGLADALIAATATQHHITLATCNTRHYPMLKTFKPYQKK